MNIVNLNSIKDCTNIQSYGQNVFLLGKYLWLFRTDGTFVKKISGIRYPCKCAFLPGNMAIVDGGGDGNYHYISLDTGEVLWSTVQKGKRLMRARRFQTSEDGKAVYDVTYDGFSTLQVEQLCPEAKCHNVFRTKDTMRTTAAFYCDFGQICLLQTHMNIVKQTEWSSETMGQLYGMLAVDFRQSEPSAQWLRRWELGLDERFVPIGTDGRFILCEDLTVYDVETGEKWSLLERDPQFPYPRVGYTHHYDPVSKRLQLSYIGSNLNVVIDCVIRKRIAQYAGPGNETGHTGAVVEDQFWVGTDEGVICRPFPNINIKDD